MFFYFLIVDRTCLFKAAANLKTQKRRGWNIWQKLVSDIRHDTLTAVSYWVAAELKQAWEKEETQGPAGRGAFSDRTREIRLGGRAKKAIKPTVFQCFRKMSRNQLFSNFFVPWFNCCFCLLCFFNCFHSMIRKSNKHQFRFQFRFRFRSRFGIRSRFGNKRNTKCVNASPIFLQQYRDTIDTHRDANKDKHRHADTQHTHTDAP